MIEPLNLDASETFTFDPYLVLQGEGKYQGLTTTLIRFGLCNYRCNFCDSAYNWDATLKFTINDLLKFVDYNIMFTGGEPLLNDYRQQFIYSVIYHLEKEKNIKDNIIEIETNGSNYAKDYLIEKVTSFNISPKEERYQLDNYKTKYKLLEQLPDLGDKYIVKFVYDTTEENKRFILDTVEKYKIPVSKVYIMPKGETPHEILSIIDNAIKFTMQHKFLFTPRIHILLYKQTVKDWPKND